MKYALLAATAGILAIGASVPAQAGEGGCNYYNAAKAKHQTVATAVPNGEQSKTTVILPPKQKAEADKG